MRWLLAFYILLIALVLVAVHNDCPRNNMGNCTSMLLMG